MDPLDGSGDLPTTTGGGDTAETTFDPLAANHEHNDDDHDPNLTSAAARAAAAAIGSNDGDNDNDNDNGSVGDNHDFIVNQNSNDSNNISGTKRSADDAGLPDNGHGNDGTVAGEIATASDNTNNNNNAEMVDDLVLSPLKKQAMEDGEGHAMAGVGARVSIVLFCLLTSVCCLVLIYLYLIVLLLHKNGFEQVHRKT